jgi:hypothetical protein
MPRPLLYSVVLLAAAATAARAQNPYPTPPAAGKQADVAGTWEGKTMVGPKDSVITTWTLAIGSGGKGSTITFPNRAPVAARVLASGGDSVVWEAGPYPSITRPGVMVTIHTVAHFKGDHMTGATDAKFASGDALQAKVEATRRK